MIVVQGGQSARELGYVDINSVSDRTNVNIAFLVREQMGNPVWLFLTHWAAYS